MFVEIGIIIVLATELVPGFLLFPGDTIVEKSKNYKLALIGQFKKS